METHYASFIITLALFMAEIGGENTGFIQESHTSLVLSQKRRCRPKTDDIVLFLTMQLHWKAPDPPKVMTDSESRTFFRGNILGYFWITLDLQDEISKRKKASMKSQKKDYLHLNLWMYEQNIRRNISESNANSTQAMK